MIDDEHANVRLLERILLKAGYTNVRSTTDPRRALSLFSHSPPDLILLDLWMPEIDGFSLLEQFAAEIPGDTYLPIIVLTADESVAAKQRALSSGASDYLTKPFHATEVLLRIRNALQIRELQVELTDKNSTLEARVLERTQRLERAQTEMLERLAQAVEARDGQTGGHTRRVGENSGALAEALGLPEDQVEMIRRAAPLHDVGKIGIPDAILQKPGPLTSAEFEFVKTHTTIGARMLAGGDSELIRMAEEIALSHHERWDGGGYPEGRSGESIPLVARIVSIVDVADALSSDRPYRTAWAPEKVLSEIGKEAGKQFDARIAEVFIEAVGTGTLLIGQDEQPAQVPKHATSTGTSRRDSEQLAS